MIQKISLVYFSGTGGVERIADSFESDLRNRGLDIAKINLDGSKAADGIYNRPLPEDTELLILIYPVYACDAPQIIYDWLAQAADSWPRSSRLKTSVISVSGGGEVWPNTGCRMELCKTIEKHGFQVVYEKMMVMPANCITPTKDQLSMWLIKAIPEKTAKILDSILSGKFRRIRFIRGPVKRFLAKSSKKGFSQFAQGLEITSKCNGCGFCSTNCPVSNIAIEDGKPVFSNKCTMCLRCIYNCPRKALLTKMSLIFKQGFSIADVEKRMKDIELEPVEKLAKGIIWAGVRNYLLDRDGY